MLIQAGSGLPDTDDGYLEACLGYPAADPGHFKDGWKSGRKARWIDGQTEGWTDGGTDGCMDGIPPCVLQDLIPFWVPCPALALPLISGQGYCCPLDAFGQLVSTKAGAIQRPIKTIPKQAY